MHKNLYNFTKKINKCDVTIKSTITKRTISRKINVVETIIKKNSPKEKQNQRKRVSIDLFYHGQLGRNRGERWK